MIKIHHFIYSLLIIILMTVPLSCSNSIEKSDMEGIWVRENNGRNEFLEIHPGGIVIRKATPHDNPFAAEVERGSWTLKGIFGKRLQFSFSPTTEKGQVENYKILKDFIAIDVPEFEWWRACGPLALSKINVGGDQAPAPFTRIIDPRSKFDLPDPYRNIERQPPGLGSIKTILLQVQEEYIVKTNPSKPVNVYVMRAEEILHRILSFYDVILIKSSEQHADAVLYLDLHAETTPDLYREMFSQKHAPVTGPGPVSLYFNVTVEGKLVFKPSDGPPIRKTIRTGYDPKHKAIGAYSSSELKTMQDPRNAPWHIVPEAVKNAFKEVLQEISPSGANELFRYTEDPGSYEYIYWVLRGGEDLVGNREGLWYEALVIPGNWRKPKSHSK